LHWGYCHLVQQIWRAYPRVPEKAWKTGYHLAPTTVYHHSVAMTLKAY
jgi:hypothetical protein